MKILEAQSAALSNWEVQRHLAQKKRKGPPNLETVVREIQTYFDTAPNPLQDGGKQTNYSAESIAELLQGLRPFDLTKGEVLMILNNKPVTSLQIVAVIEDAEERFDETKIEEMAGIVARVLG